jgi:TolB-like protein
MIGRTLSHFRILSKLGEGGMGVVYLAEDERLKRKVALKVLPPELVADEERRLRFLREARAAAAVSHPNIAAVYEIGEAPDPSVEPSIGSGRGLGIVFIAMELVEGRTLREAIGGRPMAIKEAVRVATEVAEGLAHAHQAHVVHRDLKPDNVILRPDGHAKILDFGLAKLLEEGAAAGAGRGGGAGAAADELSRLETISAELMTREGRVFGTAPYMSPEQARGVPVDARSDIFSFGSVLYEMATGRAPFQGKTATDVLSAILRDEPQPASALNPEVPPRLEEIVGKCLEKDPADRYQRADELVVDLRRVARGRDSTGQRVVAEAGGSEAVVSGAASATAARRRRAAWWAGGAGLAVLVGVVMLLAFNVGGARQRLSGFAPARSFDSLAVLPLDNLSGDPQQEFFADGMTEELIATLSKISALRVISRTSAMRYKGSDKPLAEIARELGVAAIVEGSVRRAEDRVRITVQLVDAAADRHLWAESFEGETRDVLVVQARIAREIAAQIRVALSPAEESRLAEVRPADPKAHEAYLLGLHLLNGGDWPGAIRSFEDAVSLDPAFTAAHLSVARVYASEWQFSDSLTAAESQAKAKASLWKVIELEPGSPVAQLAIARIRHLDRDWRGSEEAYRKGLELDPANALSRASFGMLLSTLGRPDEALAEVERVLAIDPLSVLGHGLRGIILFQARRYPEAIGQFEKVLSFDPENDSARFYLANAYVSAGRIEEGIAEYRKMPGKGMWKAHSGELLRAALIHALLGERAQARDILAQLHEGVQRRSVIWSEGAVIAARLGDVEEAFFWLERAYREQEPFLPNIATDPRFDFLRHDPRFAKLIRDMNLPPELAAARPEPRPEARLEARPDSQP